MHKTIKRFGMEGTISDKAIPQSREQFETLVLREMREEGYAPILGFGPFWSTVYVEDRDEYLFILSMHGIYVGRKKAWQVDGISVDGKMVPLTAPSKSKPSSTKSESNP
jgi:hypothetical protein